MEIPQTTVDRYAKLTNENRHTEALIVLCDAIIEFSSDYKEQAQKQRKALMAIETLHGYKGNLLPGLFQLRCEIEQTVYNLLNLASTSPETRQVRPTRSHLSSSVGTVKQLSLHL